MKPFFELYNILAVYIAGRIDALCDLVDVAAYGVQFLVHLFYIGGVGI